MKRHIILLSLIAMPMALLSAQNTIVDSINAAGTITIEQPAALNARLVAEPQGEASDVEPTTDVAKPTRAARSGYRIMVFDDNNVRTAKNAAQVRKSQVQARFPQHRVYVVFNSPYWRVKVGDFRTRAEAEHVMSEIRAAIPAAASSLRIVRDRINATD